MVPDSSDPDVQTAITTLNALVANATFGSAQGTITFEAVTAQTVRNASADDINRQLWCGYRQVRGVWGGARGRGGGTGAQAGWTASSRAMRACVLQQAEGEGNIPQRGACCGSASNRPARPPPAPGCHPAYLAPSVLPGPCSHPAAPRSLQQAEPDQ